MGVGRGPTVLCHRDWNELDRGNFVETAWPPCWRPMPPVPSRLIIRPTGALALDVQVPHAPRDRHDGWSPLDWSLQATSMSALARLGEIAHDPSGFTQESPLLPPACA